MANKQVPNIYTQTTERKSSTVQPSDGETVTAEDELIKTTFYPRQDQLDKLDDFAGEYNKKYRRQRKKIDRQDIVRFLLDKCQLEDLDDLQI